MSKAPGRSGSNRSFVTWPRSIKSRRARRSREGSKPETRARSVAKLAPRPAKTSRTCRSSADLSPSSRRHRHSPAKSRGTSATEGSSLPSRAAPEPAAGREQLIEPGRSIASDSARQDLAFPELGGGGVPLKLLESDFQAAWSVEPSCRMKVLTAKQKIGEDLGGDRHALATANRHAQAMDLGEVFWFGPPTFRLRVGRRQADQPTRLDPVIQHFGRQLRRDRDSAGRARPYRSTHECAGIA